VPGQPALFYWSNKDAKGAIEAFTGDTNGVNQTLAQGLMARDMTVAKNGTVYCTVPGEHAVYAITPKGAKRKVAENLGKPTGITLWPDQATLVVADADTKHLYAYRIEKDGGLSDREGYYTLRLPHMQKASGAGGLTVDAAGRLYVATPVGVQVFDPTGRMSGVLLNPDREAVPTAVALGGPDGDTLFVACGDKLFARKTKAKAVGFAEKPKQ
jgi:enterochelin esterase family protein